jgi:hypothetical protein
VGQALYQQETAVSPSLVDKKSSAQKIFGSNLSLRDRRIVFSPIPPSDALRASRKIFNETAFVSQWSELYAQIRTYFIKNT